MDNWVNRRWISQYFYGIIYISYTELPHKLRHSVKGLVNIKYNGNKFFLWCHIRHLNPLKTHPERVKKADRNTVDGLDSEGTEFPLSKKDYCKMYIVMKIIWFILFI